MRERSEPPGPAGITERGRWSWPARARSFGHAFRGLAQLLASQHNARIHLAVTLAVVVLAAGLGVSRVEWALLLLAIGSVWTAEGLNSALEWLADATSPDQHPLVGRAKDAAAAGVLIAAAAATGVGALVLGPRLVAILGP